MANLPALNAEQLIDMANAANRELDDPATNPFCKPVIEMTLEELTQFIYMKGVQMKRLEDIAATKKITISREETERIRKEHAERGSKKLDAERDKNTQKEIKKVAASGKKKMSSLQQTFFNFGLHKEHPNFMDYPSEKLQRLLMEGMK